MSSQHVEFALPPMAKPVPLSKQEVCYQIEAPAFVWAEWAPQDSLSRTVETAVFHAFFQTFSKAPAAMSQGMAHVDNAVFLPGACYLRALASFCAKQLHCGGRSANEPVHNPVSCAFSPSIHKQWHLSYVACCLHSLAEFKLSSFTCPSAIKLSIACPDCCIKRQK